MTPEQQRAAGITQRQLELWIRRGYVRPIVHGKGNPREWPAAETRITLLVGHLVNEAGLLPAWAAEVARAHVTGGGTAVRLTPRLTLHITD